MSHTSVFIVLFCTMFFYNFTVSQSKFRKLESMQNRLQSQLTRLEEKVYNDEVGFREDLNMILKQLNNSKESGKFSDTGFTSTNDDELSRVLKKVRTFYNGLGKEKQYIRNQLKLFEVALDDMKRQQGKTISEFVEKSDKRLADIENQVSMGKEFIDRKVNDNMESVNTLQHEMEELKEYIAGYKEVMPELSEKTENVDEATKKLEIETFNLTSPDGETEPSLPTCPDGETERSLPACPGGWTVHECSCYLIGNKSSTFKKAHDFCSEQEATLVRIDDSSENDFLKHMLNESDVDYAWIGLTDQRDEGIWRWYGTDDRATFFDWGPGEPHDVHDNEDCTGIRIWQAYDWNDFDCDYTFRPLCENKATTV